MRLNDQQENAFRIMNKPENPRDDDDDEKDQEKQD